MSEQARLLQTEIDVVPGRRAQQPVAENMVGPGSAIVRLTNTTSQENAYTVRVNCTHPLWQDSWVTLSAIPGAYGAATASAPGKADQIGPHGRSVKVFLTAGGTRDLQVSLNVPPKPEARAGKYALTVVVEMQVTDGASTGLRKSRFNELPALAVIRPYYRWTVDVTPEEGRRVGMLRRSTELEVVVSNESNDWLYCDVKPNRPKDVLIDAPCLRLAVPPPEPGQENAVRTLPLRCTTRMRKFRGEPMSVPVPVIAQRLDAPSVAALPADAGMPGVASNMLGAVVVVETSETAQPPGERAVIYHPPVPTTVTGCIGGVFQNAKSLVMYAVGFLVLLHLAVFGYERAFHDGVMVEPLSLQAAPGGELTVAGRYLVGSKVLLESGSGSEEVPTRPGRAQKTIPGVITEVIRAIPTTEEQYVSLTVPEHFNHQQVHISVQRAGMLAYLGPLLPRYKSKNVVQIGSVVASGAAEVIPIGGNVQPGDPVEILGRHLGDRGTLYLNGKPASGTAWTDSRIQFQVPATVPVGSTVMVMAETTDGKQLSCGSITLVQKVSDVRRAMGGAVAGSAGASAPAAGGQTAEAGAGGATGGGGALSVGAGASAVAAQSAYQALLLEDFSQALQRADQDLQQNRGNVEALAVRAYALAATNRDSEATQAAQQAERLAKGKSGRGPALALTARARIFEQANKDNINGVTDHYKSAILADPTLELPYIAIAGYFDEKMQTQYAYDYAKLGLDANPNSGILHHTIAIALLELGRKGEARQQAQKAAELMPAIKNMPTFRALARATSLRL